MIIPFYCFNTIPSLCLSTPILGVTLPVFEHYQEGGDSELIFTYKDSEWLMSVNDCYIMYLSLCVTHWYWINCESMSLNSRCVCVLSGYELTGLARGGEQVSRLKRNYAKAVELLVELASLQVGGAV